MSSGNEYRFSRRVAEPHSFLLSAVLGISGFNGSERIRRDNITLAELPYYEELEIKRISHNRQRTLFDSKHEEYDIEEVEGEGEEDGYTCRFTISERRKKPEEYEDLMTELNDDKFIFKKQYHDLQRYMKELVAKQKTEDNILLDLLYFMNKMVSICSY